MSGLKVIEAANFLSGPMAGLVLADFGATQIMVEPPGDDPYRHVHGPAHHGGCNTGQGSICDRGGSV